MSGAIFTPKYAWQPKGPSKAEALVASGRAAEFYDGLSPSAKNELKYKWEFWARPSQFMPPSNIVPHELGWKFWILLAGRGFGKTRVAAEAVRYMIETGQTRRFALVGPTYSDVLHTMIQGESGLLSCFPNNNGIHYRHLKNENAIYFYRGKSLICTGMIKTGEKVDQQRGPEYDLAWFDELGAFKKLQDVWMTFIATHRLGRNPKAIFTTTPRSNLLQIDGLLNHKRAVTTFGRSSDNKSNLAPDTIETLEDVYKDTDFAAQELEGVLRLDDIGSLFKVDWIANHRVPKEKVKTIGQTIVDGVPILKWIVMIDPSGSQKNTACECGIVVAGLGADNKAYVFEDLSKRTSPNEWARIAIAAAGRYTDAVVVYEQNFGAEMAGEVIRSAAKDMGVKVKAIPVTADQDKVQRAMLVSPLVQKGRMRLVGYLGDLEKQLVTWQPGSGKSPDRLDAFVWAGIHLLRSQPARGMF